MEFACRRAQDHLSHGYQKPSRHVIQILTGACQMLSIMNGYKLTQSYDTRAATSWSLAATKPHCRCPLSTSRDLLSQTQIVQPVKTSLPSAWHDLQAMQIKTAHSYSTIGVPQDGPSTLRHHQLSRLFVGREDIQYAVPILFNLGLAHYSRLSTVLGEIG